MLRESQVAQKPLLNFHHGKKCEELCMRWSCDMIQFYFHLGKTATETFALAKQVYKDNGLAVVLQVQERTADR